MAKIYIDTNYYLDFYHMAKDRLAIFGEIRKYKRLLVTTSQTINEFHRNRVKLLSRVIQEFKKNAELQQPLASALIVDQESFKDLSKIMKQYRDKLKDLVKVVEPMIEDEKLDPIAVKFAELSSEQTIDCFAITSEHIERAHRRKLIGNPPVSEGKSTVGDEVIWECLLDNLDDNLIIVTRDATYKNHFFLLKKEFELRTSRKLLRVCENVGDAIREVGSFPSKKLERVEKQIHDNLLATQESYQKIAAQIGQFKVENYMGYFKAEAIAGFPCPRCGKQDTWDGSRCFQCGYMSDD